MPVDTLGYEVGGKVAHRTYGIAEIEVFEKHGKYDIIKKY